MGFFKGLLQVVKAVLFVTVAFLVGVVLMDRVIMPRYVGHGQETEVPDVTERRVEEAQRMLEGKGLVLVRETDRYDPDFPEGCVISQDPAPYSWVKKGRRIRVVVSKGGRSTVVPNLMGGISLRQARILIKSAGFEVGTVSEERSSQVPKGVVIFQYPSPGSLASEGAAVDLTISAGKMVTRATVPDLVGKSLENALTSLKEAGLKHGEITYEVVEELLPETVIGQSIEAGRKAKKGSSVDLVVSRLE